MPTMSHAAVSATATMLADALNVEPAVTTATAAKAIAILRTMVFSFDTKCAL